MKPSIPQGFRDFNAEQLRRREFIFATIKKTFVLFGYEPIETPTMETLQTLNGNYGEEGDRLLYKVLNSGDFLSRAKNWDNYKKLSPEIAEKGLRYDLTVPFARYVVMHQNDIAFPFKRYQIQPVWRADSPQRGRYREFYQCDVDVVGSDSLVYEAELVQIYDAVFSDLNLPVTIHINNRKLLAGIAELAKVENMGSMAIAIDKLDKVGIGGVIAELQRNGYSEKQIEIITDILSITEFNDLAEALKESEIGRKGIAELEEVFALLALSPLQNKLKFDITLARGLGYYTGTIFEVKANKVQMGSIGGGGRYDNLTALFGLDGVSGVGVSFGAERIYDVMQELNLFADNAKTSTQLLFLPMLPEAVAVAFAAANTLRAKGVACEVYPEAVKFKKQMKYANARGVAFTAIIGEEEFAAQKFAFKNMETGEQSVVSLTELLAHFLGVF